MKNRAAIYARYSSDAQRATSIDDQVAQARAFATGAGLEIVNTFSDAAESGATPTAFRNGATNMMQAARAGQFDVFLIENLERLTRNLGEQERIVEQLEYLGIKILTIDKSYHTDMEGGDMFRVITGLQSARFLKDLAKKTHRGLTGQFGRGFAVAGKVYGYDYIKGEHGTTMHINATEAAVVQRIFTEQITGKSTRAIAAALNKDGIKSPRGGEWGVSTICGSHQKANGILRNQMYLGRIIWNKTQWVKNPNTGARNPRKRDASEIMHREVPALAIITQPQFDAVQSHLGIPSNQKKSPGKTLLSGLLKCGICKGSMCVVNAYKYGCVAHKDRGTCSGLSVSRKKVDEAFLNVIKTECLDPVRIQEFETMAKAASQSQNSAAKSINAKNATRLREINTEVTNLVSALAAMGGSAAIQDRLKAVEQERQRLEATPLQSGIMRLDVPAMVKAYKEKVAHLENALIGNYDVARPILKEMFGQIVISKEGEEIWAIVPNRLETMHISNGASYSVSVAGACFVNGLRLRLV